MVASDLSHLSRLSPTFYQNEKISEKLMTENVTSLMISKMRRFKANAQHVIKVASCLGASFSTKMLLAVVEASVDDEHSIDSSSIVETVNMFEDEGLWERDEADLDTYRFAHDQIQSSAFELIPSERRDSLKGDIGGVLMDKLDPDTFDRCLFEIVSLRNCAASSLSEAERIDLADLNLRAGIKVRIKTAIHFCYNIRFIPQACPHLTAIGIKECSIRYCRGLLWNCT